MQEQYFDCATCAVQACKKGEIEKMPSFCPTKKITEDMRANIIRASSDQDDLIGKIAIAASEVEREFYCKLTRVEEIIEFAKKIGAKKIGIANCVGLINEAKTFKRILEHHGFEPHMISCKVGMIDKSAIGLPESLKLVPHEHESMCNPMAQAQLLNKEGTELNVLIGLCVGHDSLFIRESQAPVTILVAKDRVLGHNPIAALYTAGGYYKSKLFPTNELEVSDEKEK